MRNLLGAMPTQMTEGLFALALFAGLALVLVFAVLTWPVGPLFALAGLVRWVASAYARRWSSRIARAVAKAALPYVCGLGGVAALQLAFNLWRASAHSVETAEEWLIAQHDRIEVLTGLSWWEYLGLLVLLSAINLAAPRLRLVHRFVGTLAAAETASGILATITAFSFATGEIGRAYEGGAESAFRAHLADKVHDRNKVAAEAAARRAVAQAMARLPPAAAPALGAVEVQLHRDAATAADRMLDQELGDAIRPAGPPELVTHEAAGPPPRELHGADLLRQPREEDRKTAEAGAEDTAAGEAFEAGLDRLADGASEAAREGVRKVLERALGDEVGALTAFLLDLGNDLSGEYLSDLREPLLKRAASYCERLAGRIAGLARPEAVAGEVRMRTKADALDEALRVEAGNPGNGRFERLGKSVFPDDPADPEDRSRALADAIEIAVALTPGAGSVDWRRALPRTVAPGDAVHPGAGRPVSRAFERGPPPTFADPALQRVFDGLEGFRVLEERRLAEAREWTRNPSGEDQVHEREEERARPELEPHVR
jgi:hypothetical protein